MFLYTTALAVMYTLPHSPGFLSAASLRFCAARGRPNPKRHLPVY